MSNNQMPDKPKTMKEQVGMIWEQSFNHLPHQIRDLRMLVLWAVGFSTAIISITIALVKLFS